MSRILVVEDNREILSNITLFLENKNYIVDCADNAMTAIYLVGHNDYDVIVLDIMLPGEANGYDICNTMRKSHNNTPVIMLTARDSVEDRLTGFESGADDYLIKPFSLDELEARIKAIYKRTTGISNPIFNVADLSFNTETYSVVRQGVFIEMNPTLYKLLDILMTNSPNVVKKETIENHIWSDDIPESNVLKTTIHMLRKRIDAPFNCALIHTMRGIGYYIK
ncbi:DNA-binding heavy metal response regulator [hydrothermal vent metagenome]|uniref:DNA-binding heavy metal response regulator n=1 Tax=hydrothermal vent metagenome TaxID=652676 RepID=A0A3B0X3A8_9ZZZZ